MGRRIPLGTAIVVLTAPALGAGGESPAAVAAARLGPVLLAACDVISGTTSGASAKARAGWITRELLDPLAVRLARSGYPTTFDPEFIAWLDRRLPTDGRSPAGFVDTEVTARLVPGLPLPPRPIQIGIVDDAPAVLGTGRQGRSGSSASRGTE